MWLPVSLIVWRQWAVLVRSYRRFWQHNNHRDTQIHRVTLTRNSALQYGSGRIWSLAHTSVVDEASLAATLPGWQFIARHVLLKLLTIWCLIYPHVISFNTIVSLIIHGVQDLPTYRFQIGFSKQKSFPGVSSLIPTKPRPKRFNCAIEGWRINIGLT